MRYISLFALCVLLPGLAVAGESFADVEYISGKAGYARKVKGSLTIDEKQVGFSDSKGKLLFTIPVAEIDKADAVSQREEGSFGRKMALGIFASKDQEYLQLDTHNTAGAEGVVFKVKKKSGAGMATKINHWSGRARAAALAPSPGTLPPPPPPADPPPRD